jgi:nicotinamidase-related amidase
MSRTATIVIDMLNPYDHEDADVLVEQAESRIDAIRGLIEATRESDAELIYANDNYDDFTATSKDLGEHAMKGERPDLVEPILPPKGALFVQKVRHSAFYSSALDHLLKIKEIEAVILIGQVTEQCILYSALDAYIRGFELCIPHDAVIPIDPELGDAALKMMERNMSADIVAASDAIR